MINPAKFSAPVEPLSLNVRSTAPVPTVAVGNETAAEAAGFAPGRVFQYKNPPIASTTAIETIQTRA